VLSNFAFLGTMGTTLAGSLGQLGLAAAVGVLAFELTRLSGLDELLNDVLAPDSIFGEGATLGTVFADIVENISKSIDTIEREFNEFVKQFKIGTQNLIDAINDTLAPDIIFGVDKTLSGVLTDIGNEIDRIKLIFSDFIEGIVNGIGSYFDGDSAFGQLLENLQQWVDELETMVFDSLDDAISKVQGWANTVQKGITDGLNAILTEAATIMGGIGNTISDALYDAGITDAIGFVVTKFEELATKVNEIIEEVKRKWDAFYQALANNKVGNVINDNLIPDQFSYKGATLGTLIADIANEFSGLNEEISKGTPVVQKNTAAVKESSDNIRLLGKDIRNVEESTESHRKAILANYGELMD